MQDEVEAALAAGVGGPGAEDFANGAALLSTALVREAQVLAQTAAALHALGGDPGPVGRATNRARLALAASEIVVVPGDHAARLASAARERGLGAALAAALLRAAALSLPTDDAAARIAAVSLAQDLAGHLHAAASGGAA